MSCLSICSVNVNGPNDKKKRLSIFSWMTAKQFDIILLQKTHCSNISDSKVWSKDWEGLSYWSNFKSASQGVAIFLKWRLTEP